MIVNRKKAVLATFAALTLLSACGGGSDDGAGQLSEFQVSPDAIEWETGLTTCPQIKAGEFTIIGGTAPYVLNSPYDPDPADPTSYGVTFGPPGSTAPTNAGTYTVSNRNGRVAIFIQGCFDPAVVTVLDDLKRVATIEVSYSASGAN